MLGVISNQPTNQHNRQNYSGSWREGIGWRCNNLL